MALNVTLVARFTDALPRPISAGLYGQVKS